MSETPHGEDRVEAAYRRLCAHVRVAIKSPARHRGPPDSSLSKSVRGLSDSESEDLLRRLSTEQSLDAEQLREAEFVVQVLRSPPAFELPRMSAPGVVPKKPRAKTQTPDDASGQAGGDVAATGGVAWLPETLTDIVTDPSLMGWEYVLIEDIVDRVVELVAWTWPQVDQNGRLYWRDGAQPRIATIPMPRLRQQLYSSNGLQRAPRPGDTFAVATLGDGWQSLEPEDVMVREDLSVLLIPPVYDISAAARKAAKVAYFGASTAVRPEPPGDGERADDAETDSTEAAAPLTIAAPDEPEGETPRPG